MQSRIAVFLVILSALTVAHADEAKNKQPQAVSKEIYDQITRVHDAIKHLESRGVSYSDIEPDNLGFSSSSYQECVDLALESYLSWLLRSLSHLHSEQPRQILGAFSLDVRQQIAEFCA